MSAHDSDVVADPLDLSRGALKRSPVWEPLRYYMPTADAVL